MTRRLFLALPAAAAMNGAGSPEWWLNPVRLFHTNMRERDVRGMDIRRFIAGCAATHAGGLVISAGGLYAFYPSKVPYHYVSPALEGQDFVRQAVEHGRAAGLKMIARVDFAKVREDVFRDHPDWIARRADGTPARSGAYYRPCPNSPYSGTEFAVPVIREILRAYPVDGFHINSGGFGGFCYCDHCRTAFRSQFNAELPAKQDWNSSEWRRFLDWRYDAVTANFALLQQAMRDERPGVFWTGELAGLEEPSWTRSAAYDMGRLSKAFSSVMSNIASKIRKEDLRWVSGMTASYLRSAGDRPPIINLKLQLRESGWPRASTPPAEYAKCAWQAIAHGAGLKMPLVGIPGHGEDERNMSVVTEVFGVMKRHAWVYEGVKPAAPAALLWSQRTLDYYGREDAERRYTFAAHGYYSALIEEHIPCTVVGDDALTADRLRPFRTLVMPNAACLGEAQAAAVAAFVRDGGGLVSTFETSLYDRNGDRRPGFLLEELFGARCAAASAEPEAREAYLHRRDAHELLGSLGAAGILPFGGSFLRVEAAAAATVPLVLARHRMVAVAEEVDNPRPEPVPLCVTHTPGKGRVVFFPCALDSFYFHNRLSSTRRLLGDAVAWTLRGRPVDTNAPGSIQVVFSEKPRYLFAHFINAVGRTPLDEVVELAGLDVTLDAPRRAHKVRTLLGGQELPLKVSAGKLSFRLPRLGAYECVVIEWT